MKTKDVIEHGSRVLAAWDRLRSEKQFAGLTIQQFREALEPLLSLDRDRTELKHTRDSLRAQALEASLAFNEVIKRVVSGVKSDVAEGENGEVYDAMGYVRRSERRSPRRPAPAERKAA